MGGGGGRDLSGSLRKNIYKGPELKEGSYLYLKRVGIRVRKWN